MTAWFGYPVTQDFNPPGETGMDFATPFHSPVSFLLPGTVIALGNHPWGEEVDVAATDPTSGRPVTEYVRHLDDIAPGLHVGSHVAANQLAGLSGGQLRGQLPGGGSGDHPVTDPRYSSGPHIEFGLLGASGPINPAAVVAAADPGAPITDPGGFQVTPAGIAAWLGGVANALNPFGVGVSAGEQARKDLAAAVPDPGKSLSEGIHSNAQAAEGWFTDSLWPALKGNVIPLVVAAAILFVLFGAGNSQQQAPPAPVVVPV